MQNAIDVSTDLDAVVCVFRVRLHHEGHSEEHPPLLHCVSYYAMEAFLPVIVRESLCFLSCPSQQLPKTFLKHQ